MNTGEWVRLIIQVLIMSLTAVTQSKVNNVDKKLSTIQRAENIPAEGPERR